ncbi:hypothetical protein MHBO_000882 [Bonamia ostreae]|uniref:tRNA pseudouridine(55) synthase n=1 Tax=Bonamia ostreae TaxID=126728 RepID=A0ABV2AHC5_9EUKA
MNKPKLSRTLKSCILEMLKSPLLDKNRFKKNDFEICDFSTGILLPVVTVIEDEIQHVHTKDDIRNLVISNVEKETGFKHNKNSDVIINAVFEYKNDQKEVKHIFGLIGENKKKNFSKNDVHRNENGILINMEKIIAFLNERKIADIEIKWEITRNPIYLTGNYIKTIRNISHSKGFVGDLKVATSIEEICSNDFVKFTESEKYSFSSLGREDVDVKMLGEGRPFLIELKNSKKDVSKFQKKILDNLCNKINKKWKNQVQISKFRLASQKDIDQVKKNICKSKIYSFLNTS